MGSEWKGRGALGESEVSETSDDDSEGGQRTQSVGVRVKAVRGSWGGCNFLYDSFQCQLK